jgi:hypothetical protein
MKVETHYLGRKYIPTKKSTFTVSGRYIYPHSLIFVKDRHLYMYIVNNMWNKEKP